MPYIIFFGGIAAVAIGLYIIKVTTPNKDTHSKH